MRMRMRMRIWKVIVFIYDNYDDENADDDEV